MTTCRPLSPLLIDLLALRAAWPYSGLCVLPYSLAATAQANAQQGHTSSPHGD